MPPLDSLFNQGQTYRHPLIRFLETAHPEDVRVQVDRPSDVFGFKSATLYVFWAQKGQQQPPQPYAWDDDLNAELVRQGVRSVDIEAEHVRFGLAYKGAFRRPEIRFGDGFFNAVLVIVVKELEFQEFPVVAEVLKYVRGGRPHMSGNGYTDCSTIIREIIGERAKELIDELKYSQNEAKTILAGAMAQYLDERFSVSNRIRLG